MFVLGMAGPHWPSESHRFFLIFCFLIHQRQLALTCLSANPLMLFLFMPRRPTSSTGFPEETPTKLPGASVSCSHRHTCVSLTVSPTARTALLLPFQSHLYHACCMLHTLAFPTLAFLSCPTHTKGLSITFSSPTPCTHPPPPSPQTPHPPPSFHFHRHTPQ